MYRSFLHAAQTSTLEKYKIFRTRCNLLKKDYQWDFWVMKNSPWSHYIIRSAKKICMIKCKMETISKKGSRDKRRRRSLNIMMKRKNRRYKQKLILIHSLSNLNKSDILFQSFIIPYSITFACIIKQINF